MGCRFLLCTEVGPLRRPLVRFEYNSAQAHRTQTERGSTRGSKNVQKAPLFFSCNLSYDTFCGPRQIRVRSLPVHRVQDYAPFARKHLACFLTRPPCRCKLCARFEKRLVSSAACTSHHACCVWLRKHAQRKHVGRLRCLNVGNVSRKKVLPQVHPAACPN